MITLRATHDCRDSKHLARVAHITGRCPKWTFASVVVSKGGRNRTDGEADIDTPGLYEIRSVDRKDRQSERYVLIIEDADGDLVEWDCEKADAMKIAKAMDAGRPFAEIVVCDTDEWSFRTERQAERAAVAATLDAAIEACWDALKTLPEASAKKALAALRVRCSPPKPKAAEPLPAETPVGVVSDHAQEQGTTEAELGLTPTPVLTGSAA